MNELLNECMTAWMHECMYEWIYGWIDEWMDGSMHECTNRLGMDEYNQNKILNFAGQKIVDSQ